MVSSSLLAFHELQFHHANMPQFQLIFPGDMLVAVKPKSLVQDKYFLLIIINTHLFHSKTGGR